MTTPNSLLHFARQILLEPSIESRLTTTHLTREWLSTTEAGFTLSDTLIPTSAVRFPERPVLVEPRHLPRRSLQSLPGRVALLHAVAHIEFTAILLAWDMVYRFRGQPEAFYRQWLQVAIEEASHFAAIRQRLHELGADYGDLPAHAGLWELAEQTSGDVLERLALVPRFMEARGLDVSPGMIAKLKSVGDEDSAAIIEIILREEIGHVSLGTRWFHYICQQRCVDPEKTYFELVRQHIHGEVRGPFNHEARRMAGFTDSEMSWLETMGNPKVRT